MRSPFFNGSPVHQRLPNGGVFCSVLVRAYGVGNMQVLAVATATSEHSVFYLRTHLSQQHYQHINGSLRSHVGITSMKIRFYKLV